MEHRLKTWPKTFHAVRLGIKNFELRRNDRDFKVGDTLVLCEYEPELDVYTGNEVRRKVSYIMQSGFGFPSGVCVMSLVVGDLKEVCLCISTSDKKLLENSELMTACCGIIKQHNVDRADKKVLGVDMGSPEGDQCVRVTRDSQGAILEIKQNVK